MGITINALYPAFGIRQLRDQHGRRWAELVDSLRKLPVSDPRVMAFSYTMRRLGHRMCGVPLCALCAAEALESFEGSEDELLALYHQNLHHVQSRIGTRRVRRLLEVAAIA
jgi:hypothetical protein